MTISLAERAYAAGFFDGEGWIRIKRDRRRDMVSPRFFIVVGAANTKREPIDFLREKFGGSIRVRISKDKCWADRYDWQVTDELAVRFLRVVLPYLKIKRPQAKLAIQFQDTLHSRLFIHGSKLPRVEVARRNQFYLKMKALNVKGIKQSILTLAWPERGVDGQLGLFDAFSSLGGL